MPICEECRKEIKIGETNIIELQNIEVVEEIDEGFPDGERWIGGWYHWECLRKLIQRELEPKN